MSNSWLHQESSSLHAAATRLLNQSPSSPPPDVPSHARPSSSGGDLHRALTPSPRGGSEEVSAPQWFETEWNRRIHFIDKNSFPMSAGVSEWAVRAEDRTEAQMAQYSLRRFFRHSTLCEFKSKLQSFPNPTCSIRRWGYRWDKWSSMTCVLRTNHSTSSSFPCNWIYDMTFFMN